MTDEHEQHIRLDCLKLAASLTPTGWAEPEEVIKRADELANFVLTGSTPPRSPQLKAA